MIMIEFVATSHVSPESIREIKRTVEKVKPDCIAIELDPNRLHVLLQGKRGVSKSMVREFGIKTYLFAKLSSAIQMHFGRKTGVMPGEEMLSAVEEAKKNHIDLALIDRDIRQTFSRLKTLGLREKLSIFKAFLKGMFRREEKLDITKPDKKAVLKALNQLKQASPRLFSILVSERDKHMGIALNQLKNHYQRIVVVVGAGHEQGIREVLDDLEGKEKERMNYIG